MSVMIGHRAEEGDGEGRQYAMFGWFWAGYQRPARWV